MRSAYVWKDICFVVCLLVNECGVHSERYLPLVDFSDLVISTLAMQQYTNTSEKVWELKQEDKGVVKIRRKILYTNL